LKLARLEKKLSQQQLADMAGIHQKNISKYENNSVVPSATTLKGISDALEVTTDFLLGAESENTIRDKALLSQFKEVDSSSASDKSALMTVISAFIRDAKTRLAYNA
jgi:transcriptional regulator with XRE-family HTH domain